METETKLNNTSTFELATFASTLKYEDIPEEVITKAKYLLLDYLGAMVPGNQEEMAKILYRFVNKVTGPAESSLIGMDIKVGAQWAALYNGAVGHLIDMDDIHWGSVTHAGVCIWSSALAMAEKTNASGKELLTAAIAGYEVALRIGLAVQPDHYVRGFNPSGTIMTFGAAAVAARLLKLDPLKTTHALGMAAVMVAGNKAHLTERVMTKDYNSGFSSKSGILGALLAEEGFTASTDELENPCGFLHLYGERAYPEELTKGFKNIWHIMKTGQKLYPACRVMHSSIDAVLDFREKFDVDKIEKITSRLFATGAYIIDDNCPWSGEKGIMGARFSAQYNIAVALLYGKEGMWDLYDPVKAMEYMKMERVRELIKKIQIIHVKEWDEDTSKYSACEVDITLNNQTHFTKKLSSAFGDPDNPIPYPEQIKRFKSLLSVVGWSESRMEGVINGVLSLEDVENINKIMGYL
ncbi:MmgE/PrpD family protein [Bacillus sp. REN16]|uniref:MmgE/PrpD family protein n=1 Tax=Bacillus sp. REN16 TaxID=2887296 RepID=UPI001E5E6D8C|nr:MmgE/PrpD family protein [Bacillus sp. REN16]MCC3358940.1 MmgE/PrpD family protein [Bacillus sp. REN16]